MFGGHFLNAFFIHKSVVNVALSCVVGLSVDFSDTSELLFQVSVASSLADHR